MRRIMIEIILVLVLVLGYGGAKSVAQEMISKGEETSEVNKLIGKSIKTTQGEDLGIITDVVAGPEDRAAFLVLNYWISDDTQERVAIPFGALSCEKQDCVLKVSKDALDSAPLSFQKMTWVSRNWLKTFTGTSAYNLTGQRKDHPRNNADDSVSL